MNMLFKKRAAMVACTTVLALGTISCQKDLLEPVPKTQFSDKVVFDTPARVEAFANGMYSAVKVGGFLGGRYQVYGDIRADDFLNRTSNLVTGAAVWNHTLTETSANDVVGCWNSGFQAINQINVFLEGLDANASKFVAPTFKADFADTSLKYYRGEARLLRALCYYSLLQLYARPYADGNGSKPGLPLRLKAERDDTGNGLARSTVAEVYTQILEDLNFAENNLPLTNGSNTLNVTRAHRNTAIALKTRVYLSMGRYSDVIREADKIVPKTAPFTASSGVAHAINPSISAVFSGTQETTESILSFPFTAQNTPGTQNQLAYYFSPAPIGNGEYGLNTAAGSIFANPLWAATDARRTSFVVQVAGESFMRKYPTGAPYTDKAPVIRYAEVLLSLSEARFRTAGAADPQARALLNAVRGRSNAAGIYATDFADATAAVNAVLTERRIEFLAEGLRNIDIMRQNAPIPGKGSVSAVPVSNRLYIWPIPQSEILANPLMTPNE